MFPIRDHNPSGRTPYVTRGLILLNVGIFLSYWLTLESDWQINIFFMNWGMVPNNLLQEDGFKTLFTHMFLHAGWMHLVGNMLFLWIFGDNMEDSFGHVGFAVFYILAGLTAAALQIAADPSSPVPMVGASGAIAGVLGGYLLLFPKARVDVLVIFLIFFRVFTIPAWVVLGVWIGFQLFQGATDTSDGVAYLAHVGGFVGGFVLTLPTFLKRGGARYWQSSHGLPPHPPTNYVLRKSSIPKTRR